MKSRKEILEEIIFHEKQYMELGKMTGKGEPLRSIHLGRVMALRWVVGEMSTSIKALKDELK